MASTVAAVVPVSMSRPAACDAVLVGVVEHVRGVRVAGGADGVGADPAVEPHRAVRAGVVEQVVPVARPGRARPTCHPFHRAGDRRCDEPVLRRDHQWCLRRGAPGRVQPDPSHTGESPTLERAAIEHEFATVDGVVIASSRMSDSALRMMAKQKSIVLLNRTIPEVSCVVSDNPRGVRRAAEHLGTLGHDTITYIAGPESSWVDGVRWRTLREAAMELEFAGQTDRPEPDERGRRSTGGSAAGRASRRPCAPPESPDRLGRPRCRPSPGPGSRGSPTGTPVRRCRWPT